MDSSNHIKIFDTTLRDGQQCPGAGMSIENNISYALIAAKMQIDILEAGFPSASKVDFNIVNEISKRYSDLESSPIVAGLCQLREEQVDSTIESLSPCISAKKARMHIYVPVDPNLMEVSLGKLAKDKDFIIKKVGEYIKTAINAGLSVEFSPEGYSRMAENFDFVSDLIVEAVSAGASVINCPDTIGGSFALEGDSYFVSSISKHAEILNKKFPDNNICWSAHCHNDFGLAVANSIESVFNGPVRQIEACMNGVGERAGNASLEQCVMIIKHFAKKSGNSFHTNIQTEYFKEASDLISEKMLKRQIHYPITGDNAARHSSGGHTNAILKNPLIYQPFDPKEVGSDVSLIFGPLSGGNHAKSIIEDRNYKCNESEKAEIAQFIKEYYKDRRKGVTDSELMDAYFEFRKPIKAEDIGYSKMQDCSEIKIQGSFFSHSGTYSKSKEGKESALAALKLGIDEEWTKLSIVSHKSKSIGESIEAKSKSVIIVEDENSNTYEGSGIDSDIELSAIKALINATNKAYIESHYRVIAENKK